MTRSTCLQQLNLQDAADPTHTFMYQLAQQPSLALFKHVVLAASPEDRYVPFHSARIEAHATGAHPPAPGMSVYEAMRQHLLQPLADQSRLVRLGVSFVNGVDLNSAIGRAAHLKFVDDLPFLWTFLTQYKYLLT